MNRYFTGAVILMSLAFTSVANAEIYKCNGPDGPVFSDTKCGPEAKSVEIETTSAGLGGVYDDAIAQVAKDRKQRAAEREAARKQKADTPVILNEYNTYNTQPDAYWLNRPYIRPGYRPGNRPGQRPKPKPLPAPAPPSVMKPRK